MNEEQINEAMRLGELWATYAWKACSHGADETVKSQAGRAALEAYLRTISAEPTFQQRIQPWMLACFGAEIAADKAERNHRFLEEALELVQATGCSAGEAHQLVDYVYGRPVGEPVQEIGGVMVTLAALCLAHGMDMHGAAETELARIWTKVEQIRAKQAAKPKHSPLPEMVVMAQNTFPINPNGASKWVHLQKHDGAQAIGVVFRTGTGSVGSLVDGRVVWADWLAHPNGSKPESVNAELLEALKECMKWQAEGEFGDPLSEEYWSPAYKEFMGKTKEAIARAESAIETPAKVSPCAGHAVQQEADEVIGLAQALEQHRARKIVDAVSALPVGGKHEDSPSPFHAGYQLACDEVMHRLLTEEWDGCLTPPGKQEDDEAGGA